jgi:hypothetical protein
MSNNESNSAYGARVTNTTINPNDPAWYTVVYIVTTIEKGALLVKNEHAGKNENDTAAAITTTNEGDASAFPALTIIITGKTCKTEGQLLNPMAKTNLLFNERDIISITHGEDIISTLTSGQDSAKTGDTNTTVPHPLTSNNNTIPT